MKKDIALVFYYNLQNRYSFNALVGALEQNQYFENLKIYFIEEENELISKLEDIVKNHKKVIAGFSFFTTQAGDISRLIKSLKEKYGNRLLYVAGGPHPTGDPEGTLEIGFDIVITGEGEETLIEILKKIDNDEDWTAIKSIAFFDSAKKYHRTGQRPLINLNEYPPFGIVHDKYSPIEITRGCLFSCHFCQTPHIFGSYPRHRSIENIYKYVEITKDRFISEKRFVYIRFISPNAFSYGSEDGKKLNLPVLKELLSGTREIVKDEGKIYFGTFPSEVRPEHITKETIDLILKYADNDNLIIGAQSGSQRILDLCHRGHTVEDIYNAVRSTIKSGLKANVDLIFGLPGETSEDIKSTIKVIKDLVKIGARIHAHTFMPLPQTPFADEPAGKIDGELKKLIENLGSKNALYF